MRVLRLLLLALGLLLSQLGPGCTPQDTADPTSPYCLTSAHFTELCYLPGQGAGQLTALGQRSDSYICARKGGTCNLSPCPLYNRVEGTCYRGKAKCCIR